MARKSEIRSRARAGLDALMAMAASKDEATAERHLKEALEALVEASGLAPIGEGRKKLREAGKASGSGETRLLERVGLDEQGEPLLESRPPATDGQELLDRLGLDRDHFEGF